MVDIIMQLKHKTPAVGIEPTTTWLKATRSTTELSRLYNFEKCI